MGKRNFWANYELFHSKLNNFKLIYRSNSYSIGFTDLLIKKHLGKLYARINVISLVPKSFQSYFNIKSLQLRSYLFKTTDKSMGYC